MAAGYSSNGLEVQPDARAEAEAAASRAGMPLDRWLDEAIRQFSRSQARALGGEMPRRRRTPGGSGTDLDALAAQLQLINLRDADTAMARAGSADWYRHSRHDHDEPPESVHESLDSEPLHVMERTVRAIIGHLETSDRRNADTLRHMQAQIQTLVERSDQATGGAAAAASREAFKHIEERLEALAGRIEEIDSAKVHPEIEMLEQRIAALASAFDRHAARAATAPAPQTAEVGIAADKPADTAAARSGAGESRTGEADAGSSYMSDFMRRQERRRRELAGEPDAIPAQPHNPGGAEKAARTAPQPPTDGTVPPWRSETAALKRDTEQAIKTQTAALEARMSQRFEELAKDLRASLAKPPSPPQELTELQRLVQSLAGKFDTLVKRPQTPAYDDTEMKRQIEALSQRLEAAEERFSTIGSVDATFAKLFERLDDAERQIKQVAEAARPDESAFEERFASLVARMEQSRDALMEAARYAAAEVAENLAGDAARKAAAETARQAVREAQDAAVAAAREAARAVIESEGVGGFGAGGIEDAEIVRVLQENLRQLRGDVDATDQRTQDALSSVESTLQAISDRLALVEDAGLSAAVESRAPAMPRPDAQPERDVSRGTDPLRRDERIEPSFPQSRDRADADTAQDVADIPAALAEMRLPPFEVPPFTPPPAETGRAPEPVLDLEPAQEAGQKHAQADEDEEPGNEYGPHEATEADRPREPGAGPPRAILELLNRQISEGKLGPAVARREEEPASEPAEAPAVSLPQAMEADSPPEAVASSLRAARTTNELLAAARRAAQAATAQAQADAEKKSHGGLRNKLRLGRSSRGPASAEAAPAAKGAPPPAAERRPEQVVPAEKARPAARKPIVLAVAAVILFAGSVEIYKMIKNRAPGLLPGASNSVEQPAKPQVPARPESKATGETAAPAKKSDAGPAARKDQGSLIAPPQGERVPEAQFTTGAIGDPATLAPPAGGFIKADRADAARDSAASIAPARSDPAESLQAAQPAVPVISASLTVPGEQAAFDALPAMPADIGPEDLRQAAIAGNPVAQFEIASRLAEGRGVTADPVAALAWYQRAAAKGLAPAQYRLGSLYEKGIGTQKDRDKARLWYQRAADQGNRKAMHNLAVLYSDGFGGQPDFETAGRWFRAAAELGLTDSQYNLGILHVRGLGVPQNFTEAYKWFAIVAARGDKDAAARRDAIASRLDAQNLAAAKLAAQTWKAQPLTVEANVVRLPNAGWDSASAGSGQPDAPGTDIIRNAQKLLADLGYEPGPVDGQWGPKTREAIISFQMSAGMEPTGQITPELIRKLQKPTS